MNLRTKRLLVPLALGLGVTLALLGVLTLSWPGTAQAAPAEPARPQSVELAISKTGPFSAAARSPITYTLVVTNNGTTTATHLVISDVLPMGAQYVGPEGGTLVLPGGTALLTINHTLMWEVDQLAPNDNLTLEFVVMASQTISNHDYGVRADGGFSATGQVPVVTRIPYVTVVGAFRDIDAQRFLESMRPFEEATGIGVAYHFLEGFENNIRSIVESGNPPDVAFFPQPGLLGDLAADGYVIDLNNWFTPGYLQGQYRQTWIDLGTRADQLAGVPYRVNLKSLVWYPKSAFVNAGYTAPTTWDEMLALSDQIVADGSTPWCIGIESGPATGWTATDWVEDIMLRITSPENYDRWTQDELRFVYPEVRNAVQKMGQIWFDPDYVLGGRHAITTTFFGEAATPMFQDPPACWLHRQANFITGFFPPDAEFGADYDYFYLPPIDPQYGNPVLGAGDLAAAFNDRPDVRQLLAYLSTGESLRVWIEQGGAISPHKDVDPAWYPEEARGYAQIISNTNTFRFDGSDLMPGQVGAGSFWRSMTDYVNGVDLDMVLRQIDASWPVEVTTATIPATGGSITSTNGLVSLTFPAGSLPSSVIVTVTTANSTAHATIGLHFAGRSIDVRIANTLGSLVTQFSNTFTMTLAYRDADWLAFGLANEEDMSVFWWDDGWMNLCADGSTICAQDTVANKFTLSLNHLSEFILAAPDQQKIYLPVVFKQ